MEDDVLLLNPPYSFYYQSEHFKPSRPSKNSTTIMIPLGLAYLASFLKSNSFNPICIDLEVQRSELRDLVKIIEKKGIKYVGITSTSPTIHNAIKIANYLKKETNCKIILGGVHASSEPIEVATLDCIDIVVIGEGEETLLEIVKDKPLREINGIVYKENQKIRINQPRRPIEDLDKIPFPAFELFPYKKYRPSLHRILNHSNSKNPYFAIITSRGCPFDCNFCSSRIVHGRSVRFRSIDNVVEEIKYLVEKFKAKNIMFYDDTFTVNQERCIEFCKELRKEKLEIDWGCNTRLNTISNKLLNQMKKSGCKRIYVGVESGNDHILRIMNKKLTTEIIRKNIEKIKKSGIEISASYIIGSPGETRKTIKQTIEFSMKNNTKFAHFYVFTPDPGSRFYYFMKRKGMLKPFEWLKYEKMIRKGTLLLGEKIQFSELIHLAKLAYKIYYSRLSYIKNELEKINSKEELAYISSVIKTYTGINLKDLIVEKNIRYALNFEKIL